MSASTDANIGASIAKSVAAIMRGPTATDTGTTSIGIHTEPGTGGICGRIR